MFSGRNSMQINFILNHTRNSTDFCFSNVCMVLYGTGALDLSLLPWFVKDIYCKKSGKNMYPKLAAVPAA